MSLKEQIDDQIAMYNFIKLMVKLGVKGKYIAAYRL